MLSGVWHTKCLRSVLLSPRDLFPFSTPTCCALINALSTPLALLMYFLTCSPSLLFPLTCCSLLRLRPSGLCLKLSLRMLESPLLPSSVYPVLDCLICMKVTWIRLVPNSSKLLHAVVLWFQILHPWTMSGPVSSQCYGWQHVTSLSQRQQLWSGPLSSAQLFCFFQ